MCDNQLMNGYWKYDQNKNQDIFFLSDEFTKIFDPALKKKKKKNWKRISFSLISD
jgi:hypothetical protein